MKKVLVILTAVVMCLALCGCGASVEKQILGVWEYSDTTDSDYELSATYIFTEDEFTWKTSINGVILTDEKGTYSIGENEILLNYYDPDSVGKKSLPYTVRDGEFIFNVKSDGTTDYIHLYS